MPGVHVLGDPHWRRPTRPPGRCVAVISRSRASGEVGDALQRLTEPGTAPKEDTEGSEGRKVEMATDDGPLGFLLMVSGWN